MENTKASNVGSGVKLDHDKVDITFVFEYFPRALEAVAKVSEFGARKYARAGWRTVPDALRRYSAALGRHLLKEQTEGPYDITDSQLLHAAQVAWNALARLEKLLEDGCPLSKDPTEIQSENQ